MPAPTAQPPDLDRSRTGVHHPHREVSIGGRTFARGESDIYVWHTGQTATFRITLWNITQSSWSQIRHGDRVQITLGWRHGPTNTVAEGVVTGKHAEARGEDYRYRITGRTDGSAAVRERLTASWRDATTREIIRDLAGRLELDTGYLGQPADSDSRYAAPVFDGHYQIRTTQRVAAWLDALAADAGRETGEQFEWYIDRGELSFHAKRDLPPTTAEVTTADAILRLQRHHGDTAQTNDVDARTLDAYCQPAIRKGARLEIGHTTGGKARRQGGQVPGAVSPSDRGEAAETYRVANYTYESGTTIGHHLTRAVAVPRVARYDYTEGATSPGRGGRA